MTLKQFIAEDLRLIEAILVLLIVGVLAWQLHEHDALIRAEARAGADHQAAMAQIDTLKSQLAPLAQSLDTQNKLVAQLSTQEAAQQQQAALLVSALSSIQAANRQQVAQVQQMTPDQLVAALKALGITSQVTAPEAQRILTTDVELHGCQQERDNLTAQLTNCHDQVENGVKIIASQRMSLEDLAKQEAVKDQISARTTADLQEQVKAAKGGSWFARALRDAEIAAVAAGVGYVVGRH